MIPFRLLNQKNMLTGTKNNTVASLVLMLVCATPTKWVPFKMSNDHPCQFYKGVHSPQVVKLWTPPFMDSSFLWMVVFIPQDTKIQTIH